MSHYLKGKYWLCIAALMLTTGCLNAPEIERTRLYTFNPEINVEPAAPLDLTLGVRPVLSARQYSLPMAYLDANQQLMFRVRDEWAEPPGNSVTRALTDALIATNRFKDVGNSADMARPDLQLTGELRMFHENRTETPPVAELEVRIELRPAREPGTLWAQTLRETVPLASDDAAAFAAAMNEAIANLAIRAAEAIAKAEPPRAPLTEKRPESFLDQH